MARRTSTATPPLVVRCAGLLWTLYILVALPSATYLAWLALAQVNFLYPVWHDLIGIDRTIETYGPQNRYRQGFELTSKGERSRLFAGIVDAIHERGTGLEKLVYRDRNDQPLGILLRKEEIVHLKDVAALVEILGFAGSVSIVAVALLFWTIRRYNLPIPRAKSLLLGFLAPTLLLAMLIVIAGPVSVFYWLHTVMFPPDHEWFFYYQDSLMSTLMMAPVLFGYIALLWTLMTVLLLAGFITLAWRSIRAQRVGDRPSLA